MLTQIIAVYLTVEVYPEYQSDPCPTQADSLHNAELCCQPAPAQNLIEPVNQVQAPLSIVVSGTKKIKSGGTAGPIRPE